MGEGAPSIPYPQPAEMRIATLNLADGRTLDLKAERVVFAAEIEEELSK